MDELPRVKRRVIPRKSWSRRGSALHLRRGGATRGPLCRSSRTAKSMSTPAAAGTSAQRKTRVYSPGIRVKNQ